MLDDLCVRCGRPAEGFSLFRGLRLCHGQQHPTCYDTVTGLLRTAEYVNPAADVTDLQQRLVRSWALLQEPNQPDPSARLPEEELAVVRDFWRTGHG